MAVMSLFGCCWCRDYEADEESRSLAGSPDYYTMVRSLYEELEQKKAELERLESMDSEDSEDVASLAWYGGQGRRELAGLPSGDVQTNGGRTRTSRRRRVYSKPDTRQAGGQGESAVISKPPEEGKPKLENINNNWIGGNERTEVLVDVSLDEEDRRQTTTKGMDVSPADSPDDWFSAHFKPGRASQGMEAPLLRRRCAG